MKRSSLFFLAGLLLILFGGTTLLVAENQKGHTVALATEGVAGKPTVKQKNFLKPRGGAPTYTLTIVNHDAGDVEVRADVLKEQYSAVEEDDKIEIVYLPSDPKVFDFGTIDHEKALLHRTQAEEFWSPICILVGLILAGMGWRAVLKEPFKP